MSMLSSQCDELRAMAESVGLEMPQAATLMMDAADAIERLDEQVEELDFQLDKWQTKAEYFKQLADLAEAENARLRELLQDLAICACGRYCHGCPHQYDGCDRDKRLRELGVEVENE